MIRAARAGIARIYRKEYRYKKAGVMLLDLLPAGVQQGDLFDQVVDEERRGRLLGAMDTINAEMGRGTLRFLAEGVSTPWKMRRENLTPAYTTNWGELAVVQA